MRKYRCVIHRTMYGAESEAVITVTARDPSSAAKIALARIKAAESDWVEVWYEGELVFTRRNSNMNPSQSSAYFDRSKIRA